MASTTRGGVIIIIIVVVVVVGFVSTKDGPLACTPSSVAAPISSATSTADASGRILPTTTRIPLDGGTIGSRARSAVDTNGTAESCTNDPR
jgi:hypothetical protein